MGNFISLKSDDGHELDAYLSLPKNPINASLVIVQEIFGVNEHIKNVSDYYSKNGFAVIAPAMFDRVKKNISLNYTSEGVSEGREYMENIDWDDSILDIKAAASFIRKYGNVGLCGYCWGGSVAWLSSIRESNINVAVGYYGGRIIDFVEEKPGIPVMLHFGDLDSGIPIKDVEKIKKHHPEIPIFRYSYADHGFNCDMRPSYHKESSELAFERTINFLKDKLL